MAVQDLLTKASEVSAFYASEKDAIADKTQFVENLGWLLSQTREGVVGCEYDSENVMVIIKYFGGRRRIVNVECDSYAAIIRDVTKRI